MDDGIGLTDIGQNLFPALFPLLAFHQTGYINKFN